MRLRASLILAMAFGLVVAACGGTDDTTTTTAAATTETTAATTETTAGETTETTEAAGESTGYTELDQALAGDFAGSEVEDLGRSGCPSPLKKSVSTPLWSRSGRPPESR